MDNGWIKAHRAMLSHPLLQRADAMGVWIRLLMMAAHEPTMVSFRGKPVTLERGQVAVSVLALAGELGLSHKRLRLILENLASQNSLTMGQGKGKAFTVVTLCNYELYQSCAEGEGKQRAKQRANEGQTEQEPENRLPSSGDSQANARSAPLERAGKPPPDDAKTHLWEEMKDWLGTKRPGALIAKWCKEYTEGDVFNAYFKARAENPVERISWMVADLKQRAAQRVGAPAKTRSSLLGAVRILQENGALDDDPVGPEGSDPDGVDAAQGRNALVLLN